MKIKNLFILYFYLLFFTFSFGCAAQYSGLKNSNWKNRQKAVTNLNPTEGANIKEMLKQIALTDSNEKVRFAAVEKITDQKLLKQIAISDKSITIRDLAISQLTDQHFIAHIAVKSKDRDIRWKAVKKLTDIKILGRIIIMDSDASVRKAAAESLGKTKNPLAMIPLVIAMKNDTYTIIETIIPALGQIGSSTVEPLIIFYNDKKFRQHKHEIIDVLGEIGGTQATQTLIDILNNDEDKRYRNNAFSALNKINSTRALVLKKQFKENKLKPFRTLINKEPDNIKAKWKIADLSEHYIKAKNIRCFKTKPNHETLRISVNTSDNTFCHEVTPNRIQLIMDSCSLKIPNPFNQLETITVNNSTIIDGSGYIYLKYNSINRKVEKISDGKLLIGNGKDFWIIDIHNIPVSLN